MMMDWQLQHRLARELTAEVAKEAMLHWQTAEMRGGFDQLLQDKIDGSESKLGLFTTITHQIDFLRSPRIRRRASRSC